ncbi:hypothetical protein Tco_0576807 [Tanacetum coccineum]
MFEDLLRKLGSELGSELTILASSELMVLRGLKLACYRFVKTFSSDVMNKELCQFNFCSELSSPSSSELLIASYRLIDDNFLASYEQELCQFNFLLASCHLSSSELLIASYRSVEDNLSSDL